MNVLWTVDDAVQKLRDLVRQGKIKNFNLERSHVARIEKYYSAPLVLDQDRHVQNEAVYARITLAKGAKQGVAGLTLNVDQPLNAELARVLQAAEISTEESWDFPFPEGSVVVDNSGVHPQISESLTNAAETLASQMEKAISTVKENEFNSSELFVSKKTTDIYLSSGFRLQKEVSRIYAEICYSATQGAESQEYLVTRTGVSPDEFHFLEMAKESSENAMASVRADKTPSGHFAVLVDQETLGMLFSTAIQHLCAENQYLNLPFRKAGDDFIRGYQGNPFRLTLDGTRPLGMSSQLFTREGLREKPVVLVETNRVANAIVGQQHSQYLKIPTTAANGNLILECQGLPREKLIQSQSSVFEALQFSAFSVNPMDLTFSSEIRLGRIYDNQKRRQYYVRGGNLSGRFDENLKRAQFTSEWGLKNLNVLSLGEGRGRGFWGPKWALLNDVTISS